MVARGPQGTLGSMAQFNDGSFLLGCVVVWVVSMQSTHGTCEVVWVAGLQSTLGA